MWLGEWKNNQDTPFAFKWLKGPILSLGVFFSHNQIDADELNFGAKIRELEKSLHIWQRRKLTLYGWTDGRTDGRTDKETEQTAQRPIRTDRQRISLYEQNVGKGVTLETTDRQTDRQTDRRESGRRRKRDRKTSSLLHRRRFGSSRMRAILLLVRVVEETLACRFAGYTGYQRLFMPG